MDFWIGKTGQKQVRGWLETWWLRFRYVNVHHFGREEALFAVAMMDRLFGGRLWTARRILLMTAVVEIGIMLAASLDAEPWGSLWGEITRRCLQVTQPLLAAAVMFGLSISFTRFIAIQSAEILPSTIHILGYCSSSSCCFCNC